MDPAAELKSLLPGCMLVDRERFERRMRNAGRGRRSRRGKSSTTSDLGELLAQAQASCRLRQRRASGLPAITYPDNLPISARRDEIRRAIEEHPVVIIAGETGCGKSTQIPKMCLEAGRGLAAQIVCTQPRRVAATALSRRLADELGVIWGEQVGCRIRFRDRTSPDTLVKMATDGMLLAEIRSDPSLYQYDTVIIDEAHERSLNIDYLLGYLRQLRDRRPDLKIIVTSATIDTDKFARAFEGAPIIEISGRLFPVEVRYRSLDEVLGEEEELSYVDGAVKAVVDLLDESHHGDILLFMPGERDIRETRDLLAGRRLPGVEVLAMFSRLTSAEQQRVFNPGDARRVIVSTNVAETSLTIPRIRFVVDAGLARLNRYNPRTRTQRLPIEAISRSSADQRSGRCGRVQDGISVRLYSEEDYLSRPQYTQPEIQRCDLAEVILRMRDLELGDVDRFPFIDPPAPAAIRADYQLLQELGALDSERRLTPLGRDMARLPIAPTVSRMILQAKREHAVREVLIIAAAISIQDPRERPLDRQEEADRSHRQFANPDSDFLTLLRIWDVYHDRLEQLKTHTQMRRFCKEHFLSFTRMREWRDIHAQLSESLRETRSSGRRGPESARAATAAAIHRSIASGLLGNVAHKKEHNLYNAARGREVMLFPGSGLFQRQSAKPKPGEAAKEERSPQEQAGAPSWIMAAEIVETSRTFARCVARVDPGWLLELGAHLCRSSYGEPFWSRRSGRVLARETVRLHGLELTTRDIPFARVDVVQATAVFIREALAADDVDSAHGFLLHNRRLRERIEMWQTRMRSRDGIDLELAALDFYESRVESVSSVHDLNRLIREREEGDRFLYMEEAELLGDRDTTVDRQSFPDSVSIDGHDAELTYAYRPGEEEDGVTLNLPHTLLDTVRSEFLEWLVPGLLEEKITCLLRSLPKPLRKNLVPIPQTARAIAAELAPTHSTFLESLEAFINARYRLDVRRSHWKVDSLPAHLVMRIDVSDDDGKTLVSGRDLREVAAQLDRHETPAELEAWQRVSQQWYRPGLVEWDLEDQPESVEITSIGGVPLLGYPGLERCDEGVDLRLFKSRAAAESASRGGLVHLYELVMKRDLAWLRGELDVLGRRGDLYSPARNQVRDDAYDCLVSHLFTSEPILPLTGDRFEARRSHALEHLRLLADRCVDVVDGILSTRLEILRCQSPYGGLDEDLQRLLPDRFLQSTPFGRLEDLHRYLKAVLIRAERSRLDPSKDAARAVQVREFEQALSELLKGVAMTDVDVRRQGFVNEFRQMLEEWRVSLFAQELKTAMPISAKRLRSTLDAIEASGNPLTTSDERREKP